jgi:hypothetical protein
MDPIFWIPIGLIFAIAIAMAFYTYWRGERKGKAGNDAESTAAPERSAGAPNASDAPNTARASDEPPTAPRG